MGLFSFTTNDTGRSIAITQLVDDKGQAARKVHVFLPDGTKLGTEENYDGYGVFCGEDYFELVYRFNKDHPCFADINPARGARRRGLDLYFWALGTDPDNGPPCPLDPPPVFPQLRETDVAPVSYTTPPGDCPHQGLVPASSDNPESSMMEIMEDYGYLEDGD